jgi:polyisoprenyl-phosphate glycosyltransferase
MVVILLLGGAQLITVGILGEYVGRMFDETKRRPLYLIQGYYSDESTRPEPTHAAHQ